MHLLRLVRQRPDADFAWFADNRRPGISPDATVITVHAGGDWSAAHYDALPMPN